MANDDSRSRGVRDWRLKLIQAPTESVPLDAYLCIVYVIAVWTAPPDSPPETGARRMTLSDVMG